MSSTDWRAQRRKHEQLGQRHAMLRHSMWASTHVPANQVPGLVDGERMNREKLVAMQSKVLHAVKDHGKREDGGRHAAHGSQSSKGKVEQQKRLSSKGYQFERFGRHAHQFCTAYSAGPYQACPNEPELGGPIGGYKENSDWLPDRTAPATAFFKTLPPGEKQPWYKDVPKPKRKVKKQSVHAMEQEGWRPGTSLAPRRAKDYLGNQALDATVLQDLRAAEARLAMTRAGVMYGNLLDEENLPYAPSEPRASTYAPSEPRPSTAPARGRTKRTETTTESNGFAAALERRRAREALMAKHAKEPEPEPEPEPMADPMTETENGSRPSTARSSRGARSRPSTAGSGATPDGSQPMPNVAGENAAEEAHARLSRAASQGAVETAKERAVDKTKAMEALTVVDGVADPENQIQHGHGNSRTVWVGNIDGHEVDELVLKEVFKACCGEVERQLHEQTDRAAKLDETGATRKHDEIVEGVVIREKGAGKKDWALVKFYDEEHAKIAVDRRQQTLLNVQLPDVSKDWEIKTFQPKEIHSNAAHLVQKVNESVTYRHDVEHGSIADKYSRQPKVMMGPRYERAMASRPDWIDPTAAEDAAKAEMAAAEAIGLDPNSMAGRLVRTIAAFGAVEDEKNKDLQATLVEHKGLQKSLYTQAVKVHWKSPPRKGRGPSSPASDGPDEPSSLASTSSNRPSTAPSFHTSPRANHGVVYRKGPGDAGGHSYK